MLGYNWIHTDWGKMLAVFDVDKKAFVRLWLPEGDEEFQLLEAKKIFKEANLKKEAFPKVLFSWVTKIENYFKGKKVDFSKIPLDLSSRTEFQNSIYRELLKIPFGQTVKYGDIARSLKTSGFQAIGSAVGKNPLPLVVPCHRVLAQNGPGGFSSHLGLATKERLLKLEGVELFAHKSISFFDKEFDLEKATQEFLKLAPQYRTVVKKSALFDPGKKKAEAPLRALAKSLVHQQLSGKAAATIWKRLVDACGNHLDGLETLAQAKLREVGLSEAKAIALKSLVQSNVPELRSFKRMSDREIINQISSYRGFGVWSAQMFLIFNLGRMDTFAPLDLGLQKGRALVLNEDFSKDAKFLEEWAESYAPWRTLLSWYSWRALEL